MLSAALAKKELPPRNNPPRVGSRLRSLYDAFLRGETVPSAEIPRSGRALADLRDIYNMDIRNVGYGQGYVLTCLYDDHGNVLYDRYAPSEPRAA